MSILLLILGLLGLWIGTELTVHGAVVIAQRFGISEFIVGVTILSIGSDFPELAIALDGALRATDPLQVSEIIIGSALGSALCQISFVLGTAGLFSYLTLPRSVTFQHGSIMLGSIVLLGLFSYDGHINNIEGIALITVYVIYMVFIFSDSANFSTIESESIIEKIPKALLYLVFGLTCVFLSAELTIFSVIRVAEMLGIKSSLIAIVVVGLGTSLPEFSISVGAVLKGKSRLSVGNLIGSNIFDTLIPIGVAASIGGLDVSEGLLKIELPILFVLSFLVLVFFLRKKGIQKHEAITLLVFYFTYVLLRISNA